MNSRINLDIEQTDLKITADHPEVLERPELLESLLLPLEMYLLKVMLEQNRPKNTQSLYNETVKKLFSDYVKRLHVQNEHKDLQKSSKLYSEIMGLFTCQVYVNNLGNIKSTEFRWVASPRTKDINKMVSLLKEHYESPPSIYKIGKIMETLESWGFVTKRHESAENTKFYWVIQPTFNHNYAASIRDFLGEKNIELEW